MTRIIKSHAIASADILDARLRLKLTQAAFAYLLGFSSVSVNRWEKGRALPGTAAEARLVLLREVLAKYGPETTRLALLNALGDLVDVTTRLVRLKDST